MWLRKQKQAIAAAEAGVAIISPYLNRLSAHFNPSVNPVPLPADQHVDLPHVLRIYNYYKQHDIKTILLGASIVHVEEVDLIAGLDAITIFPPVLEKLAKREGTLLCSIIFALILFLLALLVLLSLFSLSLQRINILMNGCRFSDTNILSRAS